MSSDKETDSLLPRTAISSKLPTASVSSAEGARSYGSTFTKHIQKVAPITISWHNLTVQHKETGNIILDNVCGIAKSGQFVALMGSRYFFGIFYCCKNEIFLFSGAGKTTLLNTLLSRNLKNLKVSGSVLLDGRELGREITYVSGYIQQDEIFIPTLTVREHLMIQARLRLVGFTTEQMKRRVSEVY